VIGDTPQLTLKTILYATDFSTCSQKAGLYAALIAKYFSARLVIVHAFTLSQAALETEADHKLVSRQRKDLQLLLGQKSAELGLGTVNLTAMLLEGSPEKVLAELANDHAPTLVVLGTHGGGRVERGLIGSVAEKILRSTTWPCFTVGPRVASPPENALPFRRILYATDFNPAAAHAAVFAISFAEACGAKIEVLNVIKEETVAHPDRLGRLRSEFYKALDQLVPDHAKEFCDPRTFVEVGNAHHRILQHIDEYACDLLVLGIRKTSHLGMEMRSSGAFQLIVDARCPVLTVTG